MTTRKFLMTSLAGATLLATGSASAATWQAGDWTLGLGGNVNAFYTYTFCDSGDINVGGTYSGLACVDDATGFANVDDVDSVQNGLLPASLNFSASTNQEGWDISANINVYYGINSQDDGASDALAFSTVDARQIYMTFGKDDLGTFKFGRDFGIYAFDAIINDMSLIGVGATFVADDPGHTTLGGLGFGYTYTDRLAQMNYTTPDMSGFKGTLGILQGLDGVDSAGAKVSSDGVGFHGKLAYTGKAGDSDLYLSASFINYDVDTAVSSETVEGWDVFGKVGFGNFGLAGYYSDGEGMTPLALGGLVLPGFSAVDGTPEEVTSYYVQGTYTMGKTRFGLNYAHSEADELVPHENDKLTFGVYYNLTSSLQLLGEYSTMESELDAGGKDESQALALGAILFF